jgi:hypothetical protein
VNEENGDNRSRKEIRLTPFFNTHACSQHLHGNKVLVESTLLNKHGMDAAVERDLPS